MDAEPGPWTPPTECDLCPHWMHCEVDGCEACWHDWPRPGALDRRLGPEE